MVTGMLQVFFIDVYDLLDPDSKLSFVTPFVARKFDVFPNVLNETFMVTTPVVIRLLQSGYIETVL